VGERRGRAMRVTIITAGSRGDVQPYVALGMGLKRAGHKVAIATHETFREGVTQYGLEFAPISGDPRAIVASPASDRWLVSGRMRDMLSAGREFARGMRSLMDALLADYWRVSQGSDLVIFSAVAAPAWSVAERLGIPAVGAFLQPLHRTREFPAIGLPSGIRLGGRFNVATHVITQQLAWQPFRRQINAWRRTTLGLAPMPMRGPYARGPRQAIPTLYAFSPLVVREPRDWGPSIRVTGYWILEVDPAWRPSPELEAFLADGPPPIYVGFGSMTPSNAQRCTSIVLEALRRTRQRAVLVRGWGRLGCGTLPDTVLAIDDAPHEWLLPRMAAVVHHGGSGTTAAALRSGVPSIVVPMGFDQPYWAARVAALGAGPAACHRRHLNAEWLASAIQCALSDQPMRARATEIGRQLRSERGVDVAVAALHEIASGDRSNMTA